MSAGTMTMMHPLEQMKMMNEPESVRVYVRGLINRLHQSGASATRSRAFKFLSMRCEPHIRDGILDGMFGQQAA